METDLSTVWSSSCLHGFYTVYNHGAKSSTLFRAGRHIEIINILFPFIIYFYRLIVRCPSISTKDNILLIYYYT